MKSPSVPQFPQFPNPQSSIPQSPIPPGGDLIDLGIEPKIDRFSNEVSFPPQSPNPPIPNPLYLEKEGTTFEELVAIAQTYVVKQQLADSGEQILIMGAIPTQKPQGANFLKIHLIP